MISKKQKLIILFAILIIACFGFGKGVSASYYATGTMISTNLLSEELVGTIDSFYTSTTIPAGTSMSVQFATTSTSGPWYDASSTLDATTSISTGMSTTTITGDICSGGSNFYYKIQFNSNEAQDATPELDEIRVNYTQWSKETPVYTIATTSDKTLRVHNNLTIGDSSGAVIVTGLTNDPTIDIDGDITINNSATLIAPSSSSFTIGGDWTNSGTFTHSDGTVTFDDSSGTSTISDSNTFYNLTCTTADKNIVFEAGATTTVAGTFTMTGSSDHPIILRSSSAAHWYLTAQNNTVSYVDVQYSDATSSASVIDDTTGGVDSGNNINWSFPEAAIDISGDVYIDEANTKTSDTSIIALAINGNKIATTSISSGTYSFSESISDTDIVTLFWDTDGGEKAVTVTRGINGNLSGINLYQNRVIIRQEDSNPITISNMNNFDSGQDSDILYTADTDLTVNAEAELYIWPNKEFAPGGNVTLSAGGSGDAWDGSLKICSGATFTAVGTESHSIGGNWVASSTANFTPANSIITFTSTASGKTITTAGNPFYSLTFNGSGGAWTFQDIATSTATTTITNGTLSQGTNNFITQSLTIESGGVFTKASGGGILIFEDSGAGYFEDKNETKNNLGNVQIGNSPAVTNLNSDFVADSLTINSGDTLKTRGYEVDITNYITVHGTYNCNATKEVDGTITTLGTNWTVDSGATFTAADSTTTFDGTGNSTINAGGIDGDHDFNHLTFAKSSTATSTLSTSTKVSGNLIIGSNSIFDVSTSNYDINVAGNWTNSGNFVSRQGTVTFDASTTGKTINPGSSSFYNITFDNSSGGWTITANATSTNNWNITNANSFTANASINIEVKGKYIISDSLTSATTWNSGSVLYLNSESGYRVGSKTQNAETYATLKVGANSDIRIWNSTSSIYTVDSSGSLYSQDHNNENGKLQVWGDYHATSTDYWNYADDFDGTGSANRQCQVTINSDASITVDNGASLEIKGGGNSSGDISTINASASWNLNNNSGSELLFQEAIINYLKVNSGTVTVLNTTLNNEVAPASGSTLNVDWYLGGHVVNTNSTSTDVISATTTISENSATPQSTIWEWSGSDWTSASTSQTMLTDVSGLFPQPGTNGAIRIREYSGTSTGNTYYKYNLAITANGYSNYNYYSDQGDNYITSASSSESSNVDKSISETWQRDDIDSNNTEPTLDEAPTTGTWYVGMSSSLEFGVDSFSVTLGPLDLGNSFTDTATTITYTTTTSGYLIQAYDSADNDGELTTSTYSIIRWPHDNDSPSAWGSYCKDNSNFCGFGYTTNDNSLTGGTSDRFSNSTNYAGFTSSTQPVADRGDGNWEGEQDTITYKTSVSVDQQVEEYNTTITYVCTAQY